MNIVYCHGVMAPDKDWNNKEYNPNRKWRDWLQFVVEAQHDVIMQMPKFPHAHPLIMRYDEWEKIMDFQDINPDTVLIGGSAGGGFVLKYFANHPNLRVKQVILVAPWCDAENVQPLGFYKDIDFDSNILSRTKDGMDILFSNDDSAYILSSVKKITQKLPGIRVHEVSGRGHFVGPEIPELLPIIKF